MAISVSIAGKNLIVEIELESPTPSKSSGRNHVVASSHGTITTDVLYKGKHVMVNVNAFIDPDEVEGKQRARAAILKADGKLK